MAARHILVVDDEPEIRNLVHDILEDEGYTVSTAENGETARNARRVRRPDLILLDIWMEDIDGISLLREWSESGPSSPTHRSPLASTKSGDIPDSDPRPGAAMRGIFMARPVMIWDIRFGKLAC